MNFNTNQNRHLYIAKKVVDTTPAKAGDLQLVKKEGSSEFYFLYMNPKKEILRSDLIKESNIICASHKTASDLARKLKEYKISASVELDTLKGQEVILKFFVDYMSPEDKLVKTVGVYVKPSMTITEVYSEMVKMLNKTFKETNMFEFTSDSTGITVKELAGDWYMGTMADASLSFQVVPASVVTDEAKHIEEPWAKVTSVESVRTVNNGRMIADLEYFCMGERGDQYRMMGYPNVIPTAYIADSEAAYNVIDIHFYFVDSNEGAQKSEKDVTIASTEDLTALFADITNVEKPVEE